MIDKVTGIIKQMEQKLSGYFALLNYRYCNICIKASPLALLPVVIRIDDAEYKFEDVARVSTDRNNPYILKVVPNDYSNMLNIGKGIAMEHPEFKQERGSIKPEGSDEIKYLLLTMPEVNEERRDAMDDSVKALYDDCKARMDVAKAKCVAQVTSELLRRGKEEMDEAKDAIDKKYDQYAEMCDKMTNSKYEEIEKGYQDYMKREAEKKEKSAAKKSENDKSVGKSIKL